MALPTLSKTWQFNVNNAVTAQGTAGLTNQAMWLAWLNAWLGFATLPPTVLYSCDSVTAGTAGDAVNRLTSGPKFIQNANGIAHSWIVLKQTGMGANCQILVSWESGASIANVGIVTLRISPSAGFTGGTATTSPTATDMTALTTLPPSVAANTALRWSIMQSTDGTVTRFFAFAAGALLFYASISIFANATGGTPGASNGGLVISGLTLAGQTRQNGINCGTVVTYESLFNIGFVSEIDGAWDIFPISIGSTVTVGTRGKLGSLVDIWFVSNAIAMGDNMPLTGTPVSQFVILNGGANATILIPWNNGAFNLT